MPGNYVIHVVEDDAAMREALLLLLESAGLNAEGYPTAEALLAREVPSRPVCLLADVRLPCMDGLALHKYLVSLGVAPATILITGHGDIPMAVAALKAGAVDFVTKPFDPAVLLDSVRDALRQAEENERRKTQTEQIAARLKLLTPRESAILTLMVEGHPSKVIAAKLGISLRTTEHHRAHIMEKMQARTLSQLIKMALVIEQWRPEMKRNGDHDGDDSSRRESP
jgi:two-component system response regulator FixJ